MAPSSAAAKSLRFLAVGRQGYANAGTERIAESMERAARERPTHGVLYLGDNFYPKGVSSVDDRQWRHKFEHLYSGAYLRGMPFFPVLGNHDHEGNPNAQVQYSHLQRGSARWQMDGLFYARDFGRMNDCVLMRVAFLDTVTLRTDGDAQLRFLEDTFAAPGDPLWRLVVGHFGCRSLTNEPYTRRLTLGSLLGPLIRSQVDLYLSANDRFQQILDRAGEPLHVSANGGGGQRELGLRPADPHTDFVVSQPGFAVIEADANRLSVELRDAGGTIAYVRSRSLYPNVATKAAQFAPAS
ncbi:MAG: metallophosphoesterase [Steroidobacteraceae bacterium]